MRFVCALGLLVLGGCAECGSDPLVHVCSGSCIVVDGEVLESGPDRCAGSLTCDPDGTQHCIGYRPSTAETCNGIDDDCDGAVDEDTGFVPLEEGNPCLGLIGHCHTAPAVCRAGEIVCVDVSTSEVCNGIDDDCDGQVDEDLGILGFEYHGPEETLNVGECRAGVVECRDGQLSLRGEVLPSDEVCGDDKDSDCDGALNPENGARSHDVVLVIDYSGSMSGILQEIADAVCDWGDRDLVEHNFAVVAVANDPNNDGSVSVLFDFEPPDYACTDLQASLSTFGGGLEYMLEGIMLPHYAPLHFSGAPKDIIAFTDEEMQILVGGAEKQDVVDDCTTYGYRLTVFTHPQYQGAWADVVRGCGGTTEDLGGSGDMRDTLLDLFGTLCSR